MAHAATATLSKTTPASGWETGAFGANYASIGERFSSPAVGDLDGDGVPDIVAGFPDGHIRAWRSDNGALWLDHDTGHGDVQASPLLVDFDGDGKLDIVFANTHGDVGVLTSDQRTIFYAHIGDWSRNGGAFATPAVADLNHDGRLDVVVTGFDQYLHAWGPGTNPPELPGFPVHLGDTSWSSPAIGDINGDGWDDIVFGYDCDGAPGQTCSPNYGGYVAAVDHTGRLLPGWPRFVAHQVVWSTPALADLDGDGRLDVVVGTGNMNATMWDGGRQKMAGTQVFAYHGDGSFLPNWPITVGRNVTSSPAVGDIDGDGHPDVAFVAEDGYLYAYSGAGRRLWARCAGNDTSLPPNDGTVSYGYECPILHASPTIADVMGNGRQQVLVGGEQWIHVFDGSGSEVARGESFANTDPMTATPTVASVGGRATIYEATTSSTNGLHGRIFGWSTGARLGRADWPTFKNNPARSGRASTSLVVSGAVNDKYEALGGADGFLGKPVSNAFAVHGGLGQVFQGGNIYWSAGTGAHEVHGWILVHLTAMGGPDGGLGLPTTDESAAPGGRVSDFQGGSLLWSPQTGAWAVEGSINVHYRALGGPGGTLGFPISDEYGVAGGRASNFHNGTIFWSMTTDARAVVGNILLRYQQLGGPASGLGMPTTDEGAVPGGRISEFQGGSLLWSPQTGAWAVGGSINVHYRALGGPGGTLGFPTSNEYGVAGGRASNFQNGTVFWSMTTDARAVQGNILLRYQQLGGPAGGLGMPTTDELGVAGGRASYFRGGRVYWSDPTGPKVVVGTILDAYLQRGGPGGAFRLPTSDEYGVPGGRRSDFQGGWIRWDATTYAITSAP